MVCLLRIFHGIVASAISAIPEYPVREDCQHTRIEIRHNQNLDGLTCSETVIHNNDPGIPAHAANPWVPRPPHGCALQPHENGGERHDNVDGNNAEPDKLLDAALGDAEQRDGETRLAPGGRESGKDTREVEGEKKSGKSLARHII